MIFTMKTTRLCTRNLRPDSGVSLHVPATSDVNVFLYMEYSQTLLYGHHGNTAIMLTLGQSSKKAQQLWLGQLHGLCRHSDKHRMICWYVSCRMGVIISSCRDVHMGQGYSSFMLVQIRGHLF